jgi:hypothetical protein
VVWSDNFDDGNYDGWTICENPGVESSASNWSAANGYLQIDQKDSGEITHPSNIAYGTWSFDFKANETEVQLGRGMTMAFISNDINNATNVVEGSDWLCYWLRIRAIRTSGGEMAFSLGLFKWYDGVWTTIDASDTHLSVADCHHIDLTRNATGSFSFYTNGSLVMQGVDTEMTTSELLVISMSDWHMIDNIVVRDDIPETTTTTPPPPPIPLDLIIIGGGIAVAAIVLVVVYTRRR